MPSATDPVHSAQRDAVIFDVDGTLCDVRSIRRFVEAPQGSIRFKRDFNRFHSASIDCPPNPAVSALARGAHALGFAVVVVTGREARWKELTTEWLTKWNIPWDEIHTRGAEDYRSDQVIKAEIENELRARFNPLLAVDDRLDIIAVWQTAGITTAHVDAHGTIGAIAGDIDGRIRELLDGVVST